MKKELLLLMGLILSNTPVNSKGKEKTNIISQLYNAIWSYNQHPTTTSRTNFDHALQQITKLKNKEWVRDLASDTLQMAKWLDDIYMNLELIAAGGSMMPDYSKQKMTIREEEEWKATLSKKAKQYGFKDAEYQQLLEYTFQLAASPRKKDPKTLDYIADSLDYIAHMLISKKQADRRKGSKNLQILTLEMKQSL